MRFRQLRERIQLFVNRADVVAVKDARGIQIYGEETCEEQTDVRQPQLPEDPSLHGFRKGTLPPESSS